MSCPARFTSAESSENLNRCPKSFPTQTCIYTAQGMMLCNAMPTLVKEVPHMQMDIELNTRQPFYHQTIDKN